MAARYEELVEEIVQSPASRWKCVEFFHGLRGHPESSGNLPLHDHWHINDLSMYPTCPNQRNPT